MRRRARFAAVGMSLGLVVGACGEGSGDNADAGQPDVETGLVGIQEPPVEPVDGGTLDFAVWSLTETLDPAEDQSFNGLSGSNVTSAIYSTLLRYDPESDEYVPQLAKSLEHDDDHTSWTLTLREGVKFSDGTPLDAEAVVFSIERLIEEGINPLVPLFDRFLDRMSTPDATTVVFELSEPWSGFPYALATHPGSVVSPAAVRKWGEDFAAHPVGAGPFTLARFQPGEEIVLEANPNYWGGRPHLDRLRFVPIDGDRAKLETLDNGGVDVSVLREPDVVADARSQGFGGFVTMQHLGHLLVINHQPDRPGADVRVRQAIAHSVNVDVLNQRALDGQGLVGTELFQEFSRWHTGAPTTTYDSERARQLLEQAKAEGYDGRLQILYVREDEDMALVWQAMLESVGFDVTLDGVRTNGERVRRWFIETDYDVQLAGTTTTDAAPYAQLLSRLAQSGSNLITGYRDPQMEQLWEQFRAAASFEEQRAAMADIQRRWTETVPSVTTGAVRNFIAWDDHVHGITPTLNFTALLHDAWMSSQ